jgi:hypothetical protein
MKENKEYLKVSIHLKVDGAIKRSEEKTYYARGKESACYTLDDFARTVFMWDHIFNGGSTYAYDGLLQEMEKELPKIEGETAESVFQKYWVNLKKTINEDFVKKNKGDSTDKYSIFPEEGDYLKYSIASLCQSFERSPLPVKYGFLHYFFKYIMNESIKEVQVDLNKIPKEIKKLVDNHLIIKESTDTNCNHEYHYFGDGDSKCTKCGEWK